MIQFVENNIDKETYLYLRKMVNWKSLSDMQAQKAIQNSLYLLTVYEDDQPVGMGRIVGDGAVVCYLQDLIIIPDAQGKRLGSKLIERLIEYVSSITEEGTQMMLCLMCAKGRENFYLHHNFTIRPTQALGPGMIRYIQK